MTNIKDVIEPTKEGLEQLEMLNTAIRKFGKKYLPLPVDQKDYIENYQIKDIEDILADPTRERELYNAYFQLTTRLIRLNKTKIVKSGTTYYYDTSKYDNIVLRDILPKINHNKQNAVEAQKKTGN